MSLEKIVKKNEVDKINCHYCDTIYDMRHTGDMMDTNGRLLYGLYECPSCEQKIPGNHTVYFVNKYHNGDWSKLLWKKNQYV